MRRLLLLAALCTGPVAAEDGPSIYPERPLDFSLTLGQHTLDLDYGDTTVDTSVDRIGISWRERYGERLQLGLVLGYSFLTQGNNVVTAGRELDGYHAGVTLDIDLLKTERALLFLGVSWLYQNVDDDDGAQRVEIAWREPSGWLGVSRLIGPVRAYGGVRYARIDGQQRLSGALNETRDIEETDSSGAFAGLELALEDDGYVGVVGQSGPDRSASIYFGRRF